MLKRPGLPPPLPTSSDRAAEQVDPQREDPGDADGAGQLGDVPRAGQLPRGLPERRTPEDGKPGPQRGLGVIRPRLMMIVLQLMIVGSSVVIFLLFYKSSFAT